MARRTRTAKTRAQRIDMEYFARPHVFRRWRLWLSIAAPAVALLWVGGMAAAGSRAAYSAGQVSQAHAVFGQRCERCHTTPARAFRAHVTDGACVACHDAPAHKANQTFTPACASCHGDHRGPIRLAAVDDRYCAQCHRSLKTTDNRMTVAASVGFFESGHPEFAAKRQGATDQTALRFNHAIHLKPDLRGPDGPTILRCERCHAPPLQPARAMRGGEVERMAPVTFAKHCASCHPLYFDPLIDEQAPHEKTDAVHAMVVRSLTDFIAANPQQIGKPDPVRGRIPVNFPEPFPTTARNAAEWIEMRTAAVERLLWNKTCAECHVMERPPQPRRIPITAPTNMPSVWMPRARFDHRAHRLTACASCHAAQTSREASDVLVPSIATCRQCHRPRQGAESRCFECHQYHDWTNAKPVHANFDLREVTN